MINFLLALFLSSNIFCECVTTDDVLLKSKPSSTSSTLWQVRKYMPLKIVKTTKDKRWTKVLDYSGSTYWVKKSILTNDYKCIVVTTVASSVRSGPGMNFPPKYKEPATKLETFKFLQKQENWVKYEDAYGDTGWLFAKHVWIN